MTEDLEREDITLAELFAATREAWQEELHTALPARVESYDADKQTADVTPMVRRTLAREDGTLVRETMPTLRAVRVAGPRWGRWFVHAPLEQGDFVLVVCCERDITRWLTTGALSDAPDVRLHHLAHAVAIPVNLYPNGQAVGDTPSDALVIGRDGGSTIRVRTNGKIDVAGDKALTLADNLGEHLSAIAKGLDALMGAISTGSPQPNYGAAAKLILDRTHPIATTKTGGA